MSDLSFFRRPRSICLEPARVAGLGIALLAPALSPLSLAARAQVTPGRAPLSGFQKAQAARQALVARDQTFDLLERQSGPIEEAEVGALSGARDPDSWLWSRYRAVTADATLSPAQRQRLLAGVVHQDLQLAEVALASSDPLVRRRGLRAATIANLYAGSLSDDPRLQAALYQGFLLPNLDVAPRTGWGDAPSLLEGASVALGMSGRPLEQRAALGELLQMQKGAGNVAGADMARVHLSSVLEAAGDYRGAFQQLDAVTTPDLMGARAHLKDLFREMQAQMRAAQTAGQNPAPQPAGNNPPTNANAPSNPNPGAATIALASPGLEMGRGGGDSRQRLAQAGKAERGGQGEGTEAATPDESEAMRRVRLAAEAAKRAQELTKKAGELATISLAKWLDASDAQAALDAANGLAPARPATPGRASAPPPDPLTLRANAQKTAREASEAAEDAKRAALAAQQATDEAAKLALRVFNVEPATPQNGENPQPATPVQPPTQAPLPEAQPQ